MSVEAKPLAELTQEAIRILYREILKEIKIYGFILLPQAQKFS